MTGIVQDLRYAIRGFAKAPGFTAVALLTLALGIGATTAIYALLESVVLDPLPYPNAERLVRLSSRVPGVNPDAVWNLSAGEYFYFGKQAKTLQDIGSYQRVNATVQTPAGPYRARLSIASASTLRLLGAQPTLGRMIDGRDDEPGADSIVVLSHGFWEREFGRDRNVFGRVLQVDGRPAEVVGVLAPDVDLPGTPRTDQTDLWMPMRLNPNGPFYNSHVIPMFALLRPGLTAQDAQQEIDQLTARLPEVLPNVYSPAFFKRYGFRTAVESLKASVVGDVGQYIWMLLAAVGLVLVIACVNVANLFLVRLETRRREIAIRTALGATHSLTARLFATESLVLALCAGFFGALLSSWGAHSLMLLTPPTIPRLDAIRVDGSVLGFNLGLSLLVAAALTLFAVLRQRGIGSIALVDGSRSMTVGRERQRVRFALIVSQVALALILIVAAGLLVESFRRLRAADTGVDPEGVLTVEVALPPSQYNTNEKVWKFYSNVLQRILALPGVTHAGASTTLPFGGGFGCTVQGFDDPRVYQRLEAAELTTCAGQEPTTPGYFEAMGIPLLRGRTFTTADNDNPLNGAVIVGKAFAERFWPGEDPIGKGVGPNGSNNQPFYHVVGVVGDVYAQTVSEEPAIVIYYPITRIPDTRGWSLPGVTMRMAIRTGVTNPSSVFPSVRTAVREVDAFVPLANAEEMQTRINRSMSRVSFMMTLLGVAAAMALLLAAIGLYGVMSYLATRRTNEIGVRIALGAEPRAVEALVMRGSLTPVMGGIGLGIAGAIAFTQLLRGLLFGVQPSHAAAYGAAAVLLAVVAIFATWIPARRAARVDPLVALRYE